jgi:hypothetical protein
MDSASRDPDEAPDEVLPVWIALALVMGTIVGLLAAFLAWDTGDPPARAALTGGAAFAGASTLGILLIVTLRGRNR